MRHRIALCGFSEFEFRAMRFSFQHPPGRSEGCEVVDALADADFAVVDANSKPAVKGVLLAGFAARAVFVGSDAPAGAVAHLPRPIDPARILRALDELVPALGREPAVDSGRPDPASIEPASIERAPVERAPIEPTFALPDALSNVPRDAPRDVLSTVPDRFVPAPPAAPTAASPAASPAGSPAGAPSPAIAADAAPSRSPPTGPPPTAAAVPVPAAAHARRADDGVSPAKAAARAKARRARLAQDAATGIQALRGVIVVGGDRAANDRLAALLAGFGFEPCVVANCDDARARLEADETPLAAAYLDLPLDGAALALVATVRARAAPPPRPEPAIFAIVAASVDPADRVRIALAGLAEPLVKPVERGPLARSLEHHGIPFPVDARRG